jgi:hypothetical protein
MASSLWETYSYEEDSGLRVVEIDCAKGDLDRETYVVTEDAGEALAAIHNESVVVLRAENAALREALEGMLDLVGDNYNIEHTHLHKIDGECWFCKACETVSAARKVLALVEEAGNAE